MTASAQSIADVEHNSVLFIGKKRSGKSTALKASVYAHAREFDCYRFVVWDSTREWISAPKVQVFKSSDYSCEEIAAYARDLGDCTLVVDEVDRVCPNNSGGLIAGTALHDVINCGRHTNTGFIGAGRRTCRIHPDITANLDVVFLFRHIDTNDLERISKVCGAQYAETSRRLKPKQLIRIEL